jgi:hypothetical protein
MFQEIPSYEEKDQQDFKPRPATQRATRRIVECFATSCYTTTPPIRPRQRHHRLNNRNINSIGLIPNLGPQNLFLAIESDVLKARGKAKSKWSRLALDSLKRLATLATSVTPTLMVEVNLFLAIESDVFIGTEVPTYSVHAVDSRFHRGQRENYFFDQDDLKPATDEAQQHYLTIC